MSSQAPLPRGLLPSSLPTSIVTSLPTTRLCSPILSIASPPVTPYRRAAGPGAVRLPPSHPPPLPGLILSLVAALPYLIPIPLPKVAMLAFPSLFFLPAARPLQLLTSPSSSPAVLSPLPALIVLRLSRVDPLGLVFVTGLTGFRFRIGGLVCEAAVFFASTDTVC